MHSALLIATLAITHVTVIDVASGTLRRDAIVVVRGDRIESSGSAVPKDAQIVDGHGKFLIPGLWDMHVHLSWTKESALMLLVANGVTGVRDLGGKLSELDEWRTKIAAGLIIGPRIFRAGPILNGQKFNQFQMVPGNADETRGVVRALKEVGVDFIKVHRRMLRDSYFAAIDEAKKQGLPLVGHIPMTVTPEEASDAGQATIEHVATLFEGTFSAALNGRKLPDAMREWRAEKADALFARFVKNHTIVDPTLFAYRPDADAPDPRSRFVALSFRKIAASQPKPSAEEIEESKVVYAEFKEVVRQMNRDGVTLLAGTDIAAARIPGFTLHDELAALVECGLTPLQALQAATITPRRVLNQPDDLADLVLLDADPLKDIRNTQRIVAVIARGRLFRRGDLDALLGRVEKKAAQE
ncbi:MAG TPA: amidohydrolase family protein [Thermoanaerobaculia bacterium]|nr:amidohydrolase family protein [Thermoanaerobaculia bacterium]